MNNKTEDKKTYTEEEFVKLYKELCDKTEFRIIAIPQWISRDDGSFSTVLKYTVGKINIEQVK